MGGFLRMVKAIILDCWDTLFYNDFMFGVIRQLSDRLGKGFHHHDLIKTFEKHFMLKRYPKLEVPTRRMLAELKIDWPKQVIDELVGLLKKVQAEEHSRPFPETMSVLSSLRAKRIYKLGLLTNSIYQGFNPLKRRYKLESLFDVILPSYEAGLIKPDPRFFELMIKQLGLSKSQAIMFGDSLKDDIEGAENAGIRAVLIDRKNRHPEYASRITSLEGVYDFI